MRLLNTSIYQLESFLGTDKPQYAILSHTWEPEGEILFDDLQLPPAQLHSKAGWSKVKNTCDRAVLDGYDYVWIDTLCIDKSSSAELSEAINSMFRWYKQSAVCYAFLADVDLESSMPNSRWFTRGWTLQELIAPDAVLFYDKNWRFLGNRGDLASVITSATKIPKHVLDRPRQRVEDVLQSAPIAQRMAWASKRHTKRKEDTAYCLMGIFDVNMPLLYGEGQKAFFRLQEAILYASEDQSILAFRHPDPQTKSDICGFSPVLAPDPSHFCDDIRREGPASYVPDPVKLEYGNVTLVVTLVPVSQASRSIRSKDHGTHVALLDCVCGSDYLSRPGLLLQATGRWESLNRFKRCASKAILLKSTMETRWLMQVIGSGDDADGFEITSGGWMMAKRKTITIENDRPDTIKSSGSDINQPMVLDYAGLLRHCLLEQAFPKARSKYQEIVLWKSVGLALFIHSGVEFIVAWGQETEPWCSIHSFKDLTSTFRNKLPGLRSGFGAETLLEELERTQLPEQYLIEKFKKAPFIWDRHFIIGTDKPTGRPAFRILSVEKSIVVKGRLTDKEFVGRKYRHLEIFAEQAPKLRHN